MVWPVPRVPEIHEYGLPVIAPKAGDIIAQLDVSERGFWFFLCIIFSSNTNIWTIEASVTGVGTLLLQKIRHVDAIRTSYVPVFFRYVGPGSLRVKVDQNGGAGSEYQATIYGVRV